MSSASDSKTPSTMTSQTKEKNLHYRAGLVQLAKITPFIVTTNISGFDKIISFVGMIHPNHIKETLDTCGSIAHQEWKCGVCQYRITHFLGRMIDSNGHVFSFNGDNSMSTEEQNKMEIAFARSKMDSNVDSTWTLTPIAHSNQWKSYLRKKNIEFEALKRELDDSSTEKLRKNELGEITRALKKEILGSVNFSQLDNTHMGVNKTTGENLCHYHIAPSTFTDESVNIGDIKKAFTRYVPLMLTLFSKYTTKDDWMGLIASLELIEQVLIEATYGLQFIASVQWFKQALQSSDKPLNYMSLREQMEFIGSAIVTAPIGKAEGNKAFIGHYHQINGNIINLLENGQSLEGLRKMVEERLAPNNYRRKTVAPNEGQINRAEMKLGDFSNTMGTTQEFESYPHVTTILKKTTSTTNSSGSVYGSLIKNATVQKKSAAGFAGRVSQVGQLLTNPTSLSDLIAKVNSGEITSLQIMVGTMEAAYAANTTLRGDQTIFDHLWLYLGCGTGQSTWGSYKQTVTHIINIKRHTRHTLIFVLADARNKLTGKTMPNCCLPEFLSSTYSECGTTFEALGKEMPLNIPEEGDLTYGCGVSVVDANDRLSSVVDFYINGSSNIVTCNKW